MENESEFHRSLRKAYDAVDTWPDWKLDSAALSDRMRRRHTGEHLPKPTPSEAKLALQADALQRLEREKAALRTALGNAPEQERMLHLVEQRLRKGLGDLHYIANSDMSGHPHGYSVMYIPDWEARQLLDAIRASLLAAPAEEPK